MSKLLLISQTNKKLLISTVIILLVYFLVRLPFPETIEFGYDQPRLATVVKEFIRHGSYLTSQDYALESPWGNLSWGPILIYFFTPFLLVSSHPIVASQLITVFNSLSVLIIFYLGYKFFNFRTGFISAIVFSVQPWWVIFSRMIYQPTPLPTFISLGMLLIFYFLYKKTNWLSGLIILFWGVLFQIYILALSFTAISFIASLFKAKRFVNKHLIVGLVGLIVIFYPSYLYYIKETTDFKDFFTSRERFELKEKGIFDQFMNVFDHFTLVITGGDFEYQLGYSYDDFIKSYPIVKELYSITKIIIILLLLYAGSLLFSNSFKAKRWQLFLLFCWTLAPVWFLTFVKAGILPRYFLISLPALSLLIGISIDRLSRHTRIFSYITLLLVLFWSGFILIYYRFVITYNYPKGFLSHYSDIPFSFLDQSFRYILTDAKIRGVENFTISTDPNIEDDFSYNWASSYYSRELLNLTETFTERNEAIHYQLLYSSQDKPSSKTLRASFGPYRIFE